MKPAKAKTELPPSIQRPKALSGGFLRACLKSFRRGDPVLRCSGADVPSALKKSRHSSLRTWLRPELALSPKQVVEQVLKKGPLICSLFAAALMVLMGSDNGRAADASMKRQYLLENDSLRERSNIELDSELAQGVQARKDRTAKYPKLALRLENCLIDALELGATKGIQQAIATLSDSGIRVQGENVIVIVECTQSTDPTSAAALIVAKGGAIIRTGESHVKAAVPITALEDIARNMPGVSFVRTPIQHRAENTVITEGRGVTAAVPWHTAGYRGQSVKIAVLDSDFLGLATRKAQDEIPASAIEVDFSGTGMASGSNGHGCACAEIIYDLAPGCQMYLLKSLDSSDDEAAKNYCKAQGIQIVNFSEGFRNVNFYDGVAYSSITPHPVAIVNDATANGILWIKSAGNDQSKHALIDWRDANANDYLDWLPTGGATSMNELWNGGSPIPVGAAINVYLAWNQWPVTDQDFDLHLYYLSGSTWTYVASAAETQTGTQPPIEHLVYPVTTAGRYAVAVYKFSASTAPKFILRWASYEPFYFGYNNSTSPAPGSLTCPGDAAAALTVGAIPFTSFTSGPVEDFSSLGPNNGASTGNPTIVKPDICGPDRVSTATFGVQGFTGTSAATPHIAGLAALVKGVYPNYTPAQTKSFIESNGFDLGTAGKDSTYGSGAARLPAPPHFALAILSIGRSGGITEVNFSFGIDAAATAFQLQSAGTVNGPYAGLPGATLTKLGSGVYKATVASAAAVQFYRVRYAQP